MTSGKSNEKADEFLAEGKVFLESKDYLKALICYNQSLCHAEKSSESMALAFTGRSNVYFENKLYSQCLSNINNALECDYPEDEMEIMLPRMTQCLELKKNQGNVHMENECSFKLTHPANPKIPYIADCLKVETSEKFGKYITTNRDLKIGDIIAIEDPFWKFINLLSTEQYQRCTNCLKHNLMDLIACTCCNSAMFCGEKCMLSAADKFHHGESSQMDFLSIDSFTSYRANIRAMSIFGGSKTDLEQFMDLNKHSKVTIFDYDFSDPLCTANENNYFNAVNALGTDEVIVLNNKDQNYSEVFLHRFESLISTYSHEILAESLFKTNTDNIMDNITGVGVGVYPFSSLLNHSCSPNVQKNPFDGGKVVMVVIRSIPAGEQLFDGYRGSTYFGAAPRNVRQADLMKNYHFLCDCDACTGDFPVYSEQKEVGDEMYRQYTEAAQRDTPNFTPEKAREKLTEYFKALAKIENEHFFPCWEATILMQCISICFSIISLKSKFLFP